MTTSSLAGIAHGDIELAVMVSVTEPAAISLGPGA